MMNQLLWSTEKLTNVSIFTYFLFSSFSSLFSDNKLIEIFTFSLNNKQKKSNKNRKY